MMLLGLVALLALCAGHVEAAPGLIVHLKADGDALDASGNGHNGTLMSGTGFAPGITGQAFSFDGIDDYVRVPDAPGLDPAGSFTLAAWIQPTNDRFAGVITKWGDTGAWANQRAYGMNQTTGLGLGFPISTDATQSSGSVHGFISSPGVIALTTWSHVALIYDVVSATRRIYVDGSLVASRTDPGLGPITNSSADLSIGGALYAPPATTRLHFKGLVDEVQLYDRALSECECAELAGTGSCNQAPDASVAAPSITSIWPPNNKMVDITINGVTDPDGDAVTITITGITNNETGSSDAGGIGTSTAQVRASRNGKGSGRTYTISFTADDGKGGTASGSVTVVVPHDQGKRAKPTAVENATWGEVKSSQQ